MMPQEMEQLFMVAVIGVCTVAMHGYCLWLLITALRDPGGMVCDAASPLRSVGVMLRGQREVGCPWHDKPIHAVQGLMGGRSDE